MAVRAIRNTIGAVLAVPTLLAVAFITIFAHRPFTIPPSQRGPMSLRTARDAGDGLTLTFLGVSGYAVTDGTTTVLMDPTPTRREPAEIISGPLKVDEAHGAELCPIADVILVNHTHFDHALDVPAIALRTGALVVGSQSTVNLALSRGVKPEKTKVVHAGDHFTVGTFTFDVRSSRHTDIGGISNPMGGVVSPDAGPLWFWEYGLDDTLAYRLEAAGTSLWFHPTSTFAEGEVKGPPAPTLIVGVTGEKQTAEKVAGLLAEAKPTLVLPTHYDNFFQPMRRGLALMPGLNLEQARALFTQDGKVQWAVLDYGEQIFLPPDAR